MNKFLVSFIGVMLVADALAAASVRAPSAINSARAVRTITPSASVSAATASGSSGSSGARLSTSSVRTPSVLSTARTVQSSALGAGATTSSDSSAESRLSSSAFFSSRGKTNVSGSGSGSGTGEIDLSGYATQSQVDGLESLISGLELQVGGLESLVDAKADATDTYTKNEIDDMVAGGIGGGASCENDGDGDYIKQVAGGIETCIPVAMTGEIFME